MVDSGFSLLSLLQLASPALPVGAYSYSEGLESLVYSGVITEGSGLKAWLEQELQWGAIRLDAAVMIRAYRSGQQGDLTGLQTWNQWLSAAWETEELRCQSWQMGYSLLRLLWQMSPGLVIPANLGTKPTANLLLSLEETIASNQSHPDKLHPDEPHQDVNFAVAFGLAAAHWQIDEGMSLLGYLHSWATNLVSAGIKLVPLGQTVGQQILRDLQIPIHYTSQSVLKLTDSDLVSCSWGLSLASMSHETQYSRLFRS